MKKSTLIIDGDNRGAINAINKTTGQLGRAVGQVQGMGNGLTGALSGFTGILTNLPFMAAAAATGVIVGFGAMIKSSIQNAEALNDMSQMMGISVESLSTMRYSAQLAGTEIDVMQKGIQRLSRNLYDANQGTGDAVKVFRELGISTKDSTGELKKSENIIFEIADRFKSMEDGSIKTAYAMKIFGKAGAELIPLLNEGSDGLKRQQEEARKLGLEISTNTAMQADILGDNMEIVKFSLTGVANTMAQALLPELIGVSSGLVNLSGNAQALTPAITALVSIFKVAVTAFGAVAVGAYAAGNMLGIFYATAAKVITLKWGDIGDVWKNGLSGLKEFSLSVGSIFDALWNSGKDTEDIMKRIKEQMALDDESKGAEKLKNEWIALHKTLSNDVAKSSLPDISYQIFSIDQKFDEYRKKFPGHLAEIQAWRDAMITAAIDINSSISDLDAKKGEIFQMPQQMDMQPIDPEQLANLKSLSDAQIQESSRVTTAELANLALREGVFSDTLGNMSDAFSNFANIGKNQNKALFAVSKAFAIGEAGIATYLAATKALAEVPFPFNFVAAASVIAAGIGNITRIASMQPGSAAGGGSSSAPSIPDRNSTSLNNSNNSQTSYTINFYGSSSEKDKDRLARDIIDSINKATADGYIINIKR